jgi:hypothetical protein
MREKSFLRKSYDTRVSFEWREKSSGEIGQKNKEFEKSLKLSLDEAFPLIEVQRRI